MPKKDNSQKSPSKSDEREQRPISKWRKLEWTNYAEEVGVDTDGKLKKEIMEKLENLNLYPENSNSHGGAREEAGRPKGSKDKATQLMDKIRDEAIYHAEKVVEVVEINKSTNKRQVIEKKRYVFVLDMLWDEAVKRKNITAAKEYLDRTMGKATQPIEHSGEIKNQEQRIPDDPAVLAAQSAYHEALRSKLQGKDE